MEKLHYRGRWRSLRRVSEESLTASYIGQKKDFYLHAGARIDVFLKFCMVKLGSKLSYAAKAGSKIKKETDVLFLAFGVYDVLEWRRS